MAVDAMNENFEMVSFQGTQALFTDCRVARSTVPEGVHFYEFRHADEDWGDPCEIAHGILVNHFGTLLSTEPIQLPASGYLIFETEDLMFTGEYAMMSEFLEENPIQDKPLLMLKPIDQDKKDWVYSDAAKDKERGCIGHARADFDSTGTGFHTTWWPHLEELNTPTFKSEIDTVVIWMRQKNGPLHNLQSMKNYCFGRRNSGAALDNDGRAYGFQLETKNYQYHLRCTPQLGEYQTYLYCYDKEAQRKHALETPEKRPSVLAKLKKPEQNTPKPTAPKGAEMEI